MLMVSHSESCVYDSSVKTPYKTNIAATMDRGGYVSLSADGLSAGTGYYMMAKDQLARFRAAIDADKTGRQLERTIASYRKHKEVYWA